MASVRLGLVLDRVLALFTVSRLQKQKLSAIHFRENISSFIHLDSYKQCPFSMKYQLIASAAAFIVFFQDINASIFVRIFNTTMWGRWSWVKLEEQFHWHEATYLGSRIPWTQHMSSYSIGQSRDTSPSYSKAVLNTYHNFQISLLPSLSQIHKITVYRPDQYLCLKGHQFPLTT